MANINLNDFHDKKLGSRVYIFSPSDSIETINEVIARIFKKQEANQFGKERYALFFMPGKYDSGLRVDVGFYTQVAGLGFYPTDTKIPFLQFRTCLLSPLIFPYLSFISQLLFFYN